MSNGLEKYKNSIIDELKATGICSLKEAAGRVFDKILEHQFGEPTEEHLNQLRADLEKATELIRHEIGETVVIGLDGCFDGAGLLEQRLVIRILRLHGLVHRILRARGGRAFGRRSRRWRTRCCLRRGNGWR